MNLAVPVRVRLVLAGALVLPCASHALTPPEVFEKAAPSIWAIYAVGPSGRLVHYGSAVVIDRGRLVTNCHLLAKSKAVFVGRENVRYGAKLEHADIERDLCLLSVENFTAPPVAIAPPAVRIGQKVYAIGNPEGLAQTLSDGIISAKRDELLQTSAPISTGSAGGGLFDDQARLVGITTARVEEGQNLNFAVPGKWISEIPERSKAALAKYRDDAPAKGMPVRLAPGWRWTYVVRGESGERQFTVELQAVEGSTIAELFGAGAKLYRSNASDTGFQVRSLDNEWLYELAPYLLAYHPQPRPALLHPDPYPGAQATDNWTVRVSAVDEEEISVPAGSFRAVRLTVVGENTIQPGPGRHRGRNANRALRFEFRAWYAPAAGRYVRSRYQVFGRAGQISDESVELLAFRPPGS